MRACFTHLPLTFNVALKADADLDKQKKQRNNRHHAPPGVRFKNWAKYKPVLKRYLHLLVLVSLCHR